MAYTPRFKRITPFRIDHIVSVKLDDRCECFGRRKCELELIPHFTERSVLCQELLQKKTIDEAPMVCIEIIKKPGNKCKYLLSFYI